jgi:hypothetical protein
MIVDISTGNAPPEPPDTRNPAAVAFVLGCIAGIGVPLSAMLKEKRFLTL